MNRGARGLSTSGCVAFKYLSFHGTSMAVLLKGACPLMREALGLSRECGLVYAVLWEAAWHDQRGDCGGTTELSHKGIADLCHMAEKTVRLSVDLLLDDGLIQALHLVPSGRGSWKRRYRVTHPEQLETVRAVMELFDEPPSERAKKLRPAYVALDCYGDEGSSVRESDLGE